MIPQRAGMPALALLLIGLALPACGGTSPETPTNPTASTLDAGATPRAAEVGATPGPTPASRDPAPDGQTEPTPSSAGDAPTTVPPPDATAVETATTPAAQVGWRSDGDVGGNVGQIAPNSRVGLGDGTQVTLEEMANGRPLLLYFFETG